MTTKSSRERKAKAGRKRRTKDAATSPCCGQLSVHFDDKPGSETILFRAPPEVLFEKSRPPDRRDARPSYRQKDGTMVTITAIGRRAEAIWLYFYEGILRALVMIDDLPAMLDSHEACKRAWPTEIKTNAHGVILRAKLSNGTELNGGFDTAFARFDPGLNGTDSFFEPLDDVRDAISAKHERKIKAVVDRENATWHSLEPEESAVCTEHPDLLVKRNRFIRHWHQGRYQEQQLTPKEQKLVVFCAQYCGQRKYQSGGFYFPEICTELELGKDLPADKGYTPSHLFWKDRIRKTRGGYALFPLFFRPKRDSESRGVYEYIGPPLAASSPPPRT